MGSPLLPLIIAASHVILTPAGSVTVQATPVQPEFRMPEIELRFVDTESHAFTDEERGVIRNVSVSALEEIASHLPDVPPRIELVIQAGDAVIPETGDGGIALAPGQIGWTVDPNRPGGVVAIARASLRPTLFHEVHHLVRGWTVQDGTAGSRMIDAAVSEGMATAFERDAAGAEPPWGAYVAEDVDGWVDELLAVSGLESYATWMFQHPDGRRWIGYRAGTYLADRAIAACSCSAADLVSTPTDEILAMAARASSDR